VANRVYCDICKERATCDDAIWLDKVYHNYCIEKVFNVIKEIHQEHADDLCWMDIDIIFKACGLPVPDRRVGCKEAMKKNCDRFIDHLCSDGGNWKSYSELEQDLIDAHEIIEELRDTIKHLRRD
jgi:hypothetical protein